MTTFTHPIYQSGPLADAIATFLEEREQARLQAEQEQQAEAKAHEANLDSLIEVAKKRFGPLWETIAPYISRRYSSYINEIYFSVEMPQILPFTIFQQRDGWTRIKFDYSDIDKFSFDASYPGPIPAEKVARALWQGHLEWVKQQAVIVAETAEDDKKRSFVEAYLDYQRGYASILSRNVMALALLQEQYITTFPVWQLTYGITAFSDEEGDFYADTRTVYVLSPDPDEEGYFPVLEIDGTVAHRKYYSLVALEGPLTRQVEYKALFCGQIRVKEANSTLYYSPLLKPADVHARLKRWVEANMMPLPAAPLIAEFGLDEYPNEWEWDRIKDELQSSENDEIPF